VNFNLLKFFHACVYCAAFLTSLFPAPSAYAGVPLDRIVAIVNEDVIMQSELNNKLRALASQLSEQNAPLPPRDILEKQVLEQLILNKLQLQFAANTGILVDDETLNRAISNIASENKVNLTQFREILERDGYSYEAFREDIRNEIIIARLKQRQVDNRVTVTDREIDNFLVTEEIQGGIETEYRLSHILIATPEEATAEETEQAKMVAEKVLEDLANGEDFAMLARTVSDGQQALEGGDLGWRKAADIPSLFTDHVQKMEEGEVSDLIQNPGGFHIIKLTGVRSGDKYMVTQTRARHILIRPNELVTNEEAKTRLEQLLIRLQGGDSFEDLARSHSEDPGSAVNGGDLGWTNPGDMVPEFENEMNRLEPGETSEPFRTPFGWHIVQVLERRQHDNTEDLKRARAREIIRARKIEEAQQNWLRGLRDEAYVEYRLDDT
jgi:peptidyl-prolyl cis-trans isomerase SurA